MEDISRKRESVDQGHSLPIAAGASDQGER